MTNQFWESSTIVNNYSFALKRYLDNTGSLIIVLLDANFVIQEYNQPFLNLVSSHGLFRRVKAENIRGKNILNFLMPESHSAFQVQNNKKIEDRFVPDKGGGCREQVMVQERGQVDNQEVLFIKRRLNFSVEGSQSMTMSSYVFRIDSHYLFIGERIIPTDSHFMDKMSILNNEMANMVREIHRKNREIQKKNIELEQKNIALEKAHSEIKTLTGIIPICMHCKEIRDDKGCWNQLERFITEHSEAQFSHGICPDCIKRFYPEFYEEE